jgi:hypothetical protein
MELAKPAQADRRQIEQQQQIATCAVDALGGERERPPTVVADLKFLDQAGHFHAGEGRIERARPHGKAAQPLDVLHDGVAVLGRIGEAGHDPYRRLQRGTRFGFWRRLRILHGRPH